jgi:hypothetical protein
VIKVFLRHKDEHQGTRGGDPCKLCAPVIGERDGIVDEVEESLLRDAVRFLPELAPLCAAAIEERAEPNDVHRRLRDSILAVPQSLPGKPQQSDTAAPAVLSELQPNPTDDEEILALFREWRSAATAWKKAPDGEDERRCHAELRKIQTAIVATPAGGVVGMAIKADLILAHDENSDCAGKLHPCLMRDEPERYAGTIRDLIRFAPVLEPLCADCLEEWDAEIAEAKMAEAQP